MRIDLIVKNKSLYIGDSLLVCVYPEGDCDICRWPFRDYKDAERLRVLCLI